MRDQAVQLGLQVFVRRGGRHSLTLAFEFAFESVDASFFRLACRRRPFANAVLHDGAITRGSVDVKWNHFGLLECWFNVRLGNALGLRNGDDARGIGERRGDVVLAKVRQRLVSEERIGGRQKTIWWPHHDFTKIVRVPRL